MTAVAACLFFLLVMIVSFFCLLLYYFYPSGLLCLLCAWNLACACLHLEPLCCQLQIVGVGMTLLLQAPLRVCGFREFAHTSMALLSPPTPSGVVKVNGWQRLWLLKL